MAALFNGNILPMKMVILDCGKDPFSVLILNVCKDNFIVLLSCFKPFTCKAISNISGPGAGVIEAKVSAFITGQYNNIPYSHSFKYPWKMPVHPT